MSLENLNGRKGWKKVIVLANIRRENESLKKQVQTLRKKLEALQKKDKAKEEKLEKHQIVLDRMRSYPLK